MSQNTNSPKTIKGFFAKARNDFYINCKIIWIYTKYQILSKAIIALLVFPLLAFVGSYLMHNAGISAISSGDFIPFLLSFQGVALLIISALIIVFILGIDINAIIALSSQIQEKNYNIKIKDILKIGIFSLGKLFSVSGLLLAIYIAFILPIIGVGISMTPFANFQIPNFITSVIYNNPLYLTLYAIVIVILLIITFVYIFTLHYIVILKQKPLEALRSSRLLMAKHAGEFFRDYLFGIIRLLWFLFLTIAAIILFTYIALKIPFLTVELNQIIYIFSLLTIAQIIAYCVFLAIPFLVALVTRLFYKYNREDGNQIRLIQLNEIVDDKNAIKEDLAQEQKELKKNKFINKKKVLIAVVTLAIIVSILNIFFSFIIVKNYKEIFQNHIDIKIVAHRAGGDLGAENTVEGINEAIKNKVDFVEIDVQRTKDGQYVINHDNTFKRVANDPRSAQDMTLDEVKQLKVQNLFDPSKDPQDVPTFQEVLEASKDKIGVFVELKGKTADKQMVDDVVKLIKEDGMQDQCVLLSLDYNIIKYIEEKYPEMQTGYLYYFAAGDISKIQGDYLIIEEGAASKQNIDTIHEAGKKVVVWTVNTPESINKFIHENVDGIITDHVPKVQEAITKSNQRTPLEVITDQIFS